MRQGRGQDMVAAAEFVVGVHVVRAGRRKPVSIAGHRRDQVHDTIIRDQAIATATAAGDGPGYGQKLGGVQRECAPQAGRASGPAPFQSPSTQPTPAAAKSAASFARRHIGEQVSAIPDRPVPGPDQGHRPEGCAIAPVRRKHAAPETLFRIYVSLAFLFGRQHAQPTRFTRTRWRR